RSARTGSPSVPRLVRDPHLARAVSRHSDDVLASVGVELLAGHVLADHAEVTAPPAAAEPTLEQLYIDRRRFGVGQRVAHGRAPVVDSPIDLDSTHFVAIDEHAISRVPLVFCSGNSIAAFDFSLDENVECIASAQCQFAAHRGMADAVLA